MDNLTGADNIRKEMEEKMASGKLAKNVCSGDAETSWSQKDRELLAGTQEFFQDGDHQWPDAC